SKWTVTAGLWSNPLPLVCTPVNALAVFNSQLVLVGGGFVDGGPPCSPASPWVASIALWDGDNAWVALGTSVSGYLGIVLVYALAVLGSDVYVGGAFTGPAGYKNIARWAAGAWKGWGGYYGPVTVLHHTPLGHLFAGGDFTNAAGVDANRVAKWNGNTW